MATTDRAVKLTYEDYRITPDDKRYELLNGDLMMVPAPNMSHQRVQAVPFTETFLVPRAGYRPMLHCLTRR